ncbi:hypothetical protein NQ314_021433 [Rhamnusium bicolor]|uniref:Peptidase C1A papain C-terminal domain-containing protein n=1 Tax=Rhamnusium bicolor TaxID=1586634 RepID=A0AAV8WI60_9CUCU|nr:hypothetical protein NQ314_021433 [Rhamnusium bicolor]
MGNRLSPEAWGWKKCDEILVPVATILTVAPEELLHISCACKCGCGARCFCRTAGLACSMMCVHCRGRICYHDIEGCKSYAFSPCAHHIESEIPACVGSGPTPSCIRQCDEGSSLTYDSDLTFGETAYHINEDEKQIRMEIMTHGPVEAGFTVYEDFLSYKSGVYQHIIGEELGGHAIKILGWGIEDNIPYWLVANSWNSEWGENGYFKILRGQNHVGIESDIVAGLPKL